MSSRSFRLETRSRARDEIKRIMQTVEKVRKWEKIWIETGLSNHLKVYKWVPVRDEGKKEEEEEKSEMQEQEDPETKVKGDKNEAALPEILPAKGLTASLEPGQLASGPPDLLLDTETNPLPSGGKETSERVSSLPDEEQQRVDLEKRKERQKAVGKETKEREDRPRSPH